MNTSSELKNLVKEKYGQIAQQSKQDNAASCCGATASCSTVDHAVFAENYSNLQGYVEDADLGLGCGIPTKFANINSSDTVIDLGSGAGNDAFIAREIVGDNGFVYGVDMTEVMIDKAKENAKKLNFKNVHFRLGEIEALPFTDEFADVIISNCVLNLVPNKSKAFSEIFRVLKRKGHFSISDVVLDGELPNEILNAAEMYAGCVSGAIQRKEYIEIIEQSGFSNISIGKNQQIELPDEILSKYLSHDQINDFRHNNSGIYSITITADKPN